MTEKEFGALVEGRLGIPDEVRVKIDKSSSPYWCAVFTDREARAWWWLTVYFGRKDGTYGPVRFELFGEDMDHDPQVTVGAQGLAFMAWAQKVRELYDEVTL